MVNPLLFLYYCTVRNGVRRTLLSNSASLSKLIDTKIQLVEKEPLMTPPPLHTPKPSPPIPSPLYHCLLLELWILGFTAKQSEKRGSGRVRSSTAPLSIYLLLPFPRILSFCLSSRLSFPPSSLSWGSERGWIKQDCDF